MQAFVDALRGKTPPPIPFEQVVGSTLATLRLQNSCQTGQSLMVDLSEFIASALQEHNFDVVEQPARNELEATMQRKKGTSRKC